LGFIFTVVVARERYATVLIPRFPQLGVRLAEGGGEHGIADIGSIGACPLLDPVWRASNHQNDGN